MGEHSLGSVITNGIRISPYITNLHFKELFPSQKCNTSQPSLPRIVPKDFQLFPKLLKELQITIWEFARPAARVIKPLMSRNQQLICSSAPIPVLLHVCKLSRKIAEKWFTLALLSDNDSCENRRVWLDLSRDILYQCDDPGQCTCFQNPCGKDYVSTEDRHKVQRLAIEWPVGERLRFRDIEQWYRGAKKVMIVDKSCLMREAFAEGEFFVENEQKFDWQGNHDLITC